MRHRCLVFLNRLYAGFFDQRGVTTLEWVALATVVAMMVLSIVAVLSRGDIAHAADCALQRQVQLFGGKPSSCSP